MKLDVNATLEKLKKSLQEATDLMQPWGQFHDEVAMVPFFSMNGTVEGNPRIERGLEMAGEHLLKQRWKASHTHFVHFAGHHFWHGTCEVGPRTVIFFFFDDIEVGLAGYFRAVTDAYVELVRVTVFERREEGRAQFN